MGIGSIFPNRRRVRCGDGEGYASRVLDVPVKRVARFLWEIRGINREARDQGRFILPEVADTLLPGKATKLQPVGTVPQTDTGGQDENSQALERTQEKELGKLTP
jgi:hypothetical protein